MIKNTTILYFVKKNFRFDYLFVIHWLVQFAYMFAFSNSHVRPFTSTFCSGFLWRAWAEILAFNSHKLPLDVKNGGSTRGRVNIASSCGGAKKSFNVPAVLHNPSSRSKSFLFSINYHKLFLIADRLLSVPV